MRRGRLRVLLGAAPGVGKTYTMLEEGRRLAGEGHDVVVAFVETHGRTATAAMVDGLEVVARRTETHRGLALEEMDVDAVLARKPEIALVDDVAHEQHAKPPPFHRGYPSSSARARFSCSTLTVGSPRYPRSRA